MMGRVKYNRHKLSVFQKRVYDYYLQYKRVLPWRKTTNPYFILVSEIMLQQTQVSRVLEKYTSFIKRFPDFQSLAASGNADVLRVWQGMGYNRRALYLKRIAEKVVKDYGGILPRSVPELDLLPGIGEATAASIAVFAYNIPTVFIETNIRRVFLHHFFRDKIDIDDRELFPLVEATLDYKNPREWYYALMDYGSFLGKMAENPNKRSKHYTVQVSFEGSNRQLRGKILRLLLHGQKKRSELAAALDADSSRVNELLKEMSKEGFIRIKRNICIIS